MTKISLINLMVIGLPQYKQSKLKRADITSVDDLFEEVKSGHHSSTIQTKFKQNIKKTETVEVKHNKKQKLPISKVIKTPCIECLI